MKKLKVKYGVVVVLLTLVANIQGNGQQLSTADSLYLASMRSELSLAPWQQNKIDSLVLATSSEIILIDKENQRLARSSSIDQPKRDSLQVELRERKKLIKSTRELNIQLLLTPEQVRIYDEKIKPGKPAVIHMGINHDRANCTICLPK